MIKISEEVFVRCRHCGTHVERSNDATVLEAIWKNKVIPTEQDRAKAGGLHLLEVYNDHTLICPGDQILSSYLQGHRWVVNCTYSLTKIAEIRRAYYQLQGV